MDAQADLVAFFPDEGAMKRYSDMANMTYAFGIKNRDWATGKILGLGIMNAELVKDKNVLIIDYICSRGGTFLHSAKALKEAGANRIFLYVTHAEKTMVEGEMYNNLDLVERIYTTDSIFNIEWDDRNKVTIVNKF
jgi:ribose-phosphate pyrophosphokinase